MDAREFCVYTIRYWFVFLFFCFFRSKEGRNENKHEHKKIYIIMIRYTHKITPAYLLLRFVFVVALDSVCINVPIVASKWSCKIGNRVIFGFYSVAHSIAVLLVQWHLVERDEIHCFCNPFFSRMEKKVVRMTCQRFEFSFCQCVVKREFYVYTCMCMARWTEPLSHLKGWCSQYLRYTKSWRNSAAHSFDLQWNQPLCYHRWCCLLFIATARSQCRFFFPFCICRFVWCVTRMNESGDAMIFFFSYYVNSVIM